MLCGVAGVVGIIVDRPLYCLRKTYVERMIYYWLIIISLTMATRLQPSFPLQAIVT
jgi:hypothetical protein